MALKKTSDAVKVREYLRASITDRFGSLTAYANKEGVSMQYVSKVVLGEKPIPAWMLKRFKITHVVQEHWEVAA